MLHYLEGVSWRVLEEYPQFIRQMIRRRAGIYALYRRDKLYYIGLAQNLMGRLKTHLRDRHRGSWDRFSVYLTIHDEHMRELEALLLRIVAPSGNRTKGRFAEASSLLPALDHFMQESDADKRAQIIGDPAVRRRRRQRIRGASRTLPLAGVVERSTPLRAEYRGRTYKARLRPNGWINYRDVLYASPSAAARRAARRPVNGWQFWQYRDRGRWVPLAQLKR